MPSAAETAGTLRDLLSTPVAAAGFDVEDIVVNRAGSRSVVRIVVDRDGGIDLDAVAVASRVIGEVLDAHDDAVPGAYALEVTSPGVDRPLTAPRHWRRNIGRLVTVSLTEGGELTGRITAATDDSVTVEQTVVPLAGVSRGTVQIEFNRPKGEPDIEDETGGDGTDSDETDSDEYDESDEDDA